MSLIFFFNFMVLYRALFEIISYLKRIINNHLTKLIIINNFFKFMEVISTFIYNFIKMMQNCKKKNKKNEKLKKNISCFRYNH